MAKPIESKINVTEALNKGVNFFATASLGIVGIQALYEGIAEHELNDKLDDILLILTAIVGIAWYHLGGNKYKRTFSPGIFLIIGLIIKIGAFVIEHDDLEAVGPDYGILAVLVSALIIFLWQFFAAKRESSELR